MALLGDATTTAAKDSGTVALLARRLSETTTEGAGKALQWTSEKWRAGNDWAFKIGSQMEEVQRLALAVDYIKKAQAVGQPVTPKLLDQAATHAKHHLIDYGDLTTFEKQFKNVMPFYAWYRGIIGKTITDVASRPIFMANLDRGLDLMLAPLPVEDERIMPEWMQGKSPVQWGQSAEGHPQVALASRFLPWATVNEMVARPQSAAPGAINPILKAPLEVLGNQSFFTGRPIDESADSGLGALVNPLPGVPGEYDLADRSMLGQNMPAMWQHLATTVNPVGRHLLMADQMLQGVTPGLTDPTRPQMSWGEKAVYLGTGGKVYPFDRGKYQFQFQRKQDAATMRVRKQMKRALQKGDDAKYEHYEQMLQRLQEQRYQNSRNPESGGR